MTTANSTFNHQLKLEVSNQTTLHHRMQDNDAFPSTDLVRPPPLDEPIGVLVLAKYKLRSSSLQGIIEWLCKGIVQCYRVILLALYEATKKVILQLKLILVDVAFGQE
ncbi:hypothetical protein SEMRO_1387_G268340.1 [Seminavis robusta]|uniref:Uncharacterized protein n=1 Tax=Seminavis robusta TaxID=568900 RepID=A0A9N8HUI3_9STRA|nr:hypothetical protein SEMRO_1387_G268340.1 [Seminavis robusta]|eukprot:Sro1387_g268340.1 n/a (108) ;mRNA; r:6838-7161